MAGTRTSVNRAEASMLAEINIPRSRLGRTCESPSVRNPAASASALMTMAGPVVSIAARTASRRASPRPIRSRHTATK